MFATYTLPSAVRGMLVHMIRSDQSCYYSMSFEWTVCVHLKYKDIHVNVKGKGSSVLEKGITGQIGSFILLLHTKRQCHVFILQNREVILSKYQQCVATGMCAYIQFSIYEDNWHLNTTTL